MGGARTDPVFQSTSGASPEGQPLAQSRSAMSILLALLTLAAPADDAAFRVPSPPPCAWDVEAFTLLSPPDNGFIPENGAFWMRENDGVTPLTSLPPQLFNHGELQRLETTEIVIPIPTGTMIGS